MTQWLSQCGRADLRCGDSLQVMPTLAADSVDAIVTDPPYGLTFMGKEWDRGVPGVEFWREAYRVAKPGAHLLAFGGTRTYHRQTCAIEDAGWEIRDCIMWVYGSGFPKSLDVSKAIDKAAGAEREVVGYSRGVSVEDDKGLGGIARGGVGIVQKAVDVPITAPATDAARKWSGWGTALKPAVEYIVVAQKPLDLSGLCGTLALTIGEAICQLQLGVSAAARTSTSSQREFGAEFGSALWIAAGKCNTQEGLCELMGTSRSGLATRSFLSTALSWLDILGAILRAASTFTTEMVSSLTTDLKILSCLSSRNIADSIIGAAIYPNGTGSSASFAESIFSVVEFKLASILTSSAPGFATLPGSAPGLRPDWRPIVVARKPLQGTVAANVLRHGTGAINVDGCRIAAPPDDPANGAVFTNRPSVVRPGTVGFVTSNSEGQKQPPVDFSTKGRWPANLIHDGSDEVVDGFPQDGESSAARFFYCAKADGEDRDHGNTHPTVKPNDLMRYLIKLIAPKDALILDPFMGSGSTGVAAIQMHNRFIGIELGDDHFEICKRRVEAAFDTFPLLNPKGDQ